MLLYVPAVYPDPEAVMFPVSDWMSACNVPPIPPPPVNVRVGADVYPNPTSVTERDDILPSCSFKTATNCASCVASPVDGTTDGKFLYLLLSL